ncbi:MAG: hypothetical protein Q8R47_01280 [Nanoarchaeota archaeon]|nr:hypothetical protein [Nanoarchaeota archaeon]
MNKKIRMILNPFIFSVIYVFILIFSQVILQLISKTIGSFSLILFFLFTAVIYLITLWLMLKVTLTEHGKKDDKWILSIYLVLFVTIELFLIKAVPLILFGELSSARLVDSLVSINSIIPILISVTFPFFYKRKSA